MFNVVGLENDELPVQADGKGDYSGLWRRTVRFERRWMVSNEWCLGILLAPFSTTLIIFATFTDRLSGRKRQKDWWFLWLGLLRKPMTCFRKTRRGLTRFWMFRAKSRLKWARPWKGRSWWPSFWEIQLKRSTNWLEISESSSLNFTRTSTPNILLWTQFSMPLGRPYKPWLAFKDIFWLRWIPWVGYCFTFLSFC